MMTTNLFVIANVKQLRTDGSFRTLLPFFRTFWGVGVPNSAIFKSFHNRVEFGTILEGLRNFGGGLNTHTPHGTPLSQRADFVWHTHLLLSILNRPQYGFQSVAPYTLFSMPLSMLCSSFVFPLLFYLK